MSENKEVVAEKPILHDKDVKEQQDPKAQESAKATSSEQKDLLKVDMDEEIKAGKKIGSKALKLTVILIAVLVIVKVVLDMCA